MMAAPMKSSNGLESQLHSLVFDQKHMTARGLRFLREKTGFDEYNLAILIIGLTCVYLMAGHAAHTVANAILTVTPILLTYVFPAEKPPTPALLIYWGVFGLLTLLDPNFEPTSGYYLIKVILLAFLFLHPFDGADRILWHIRLAHSSISIDEPAMSPFTKEELSAMELKLLKKRLLLSEGFEATKPEGNSFREATRSVSGEGINPMLIDSGYRIGDQSFTSIENLSSSYNPHDLAFEPTQNLVFNGPFDFENLTYLLRIYNTSTKYIAFAIKSNAIPRVLASPPCGILPPKQKRDVAITVKKMESFNEELVAKDRLAFDYVFCPPETKKFTFDLLKTEMRRRKNIYIKYNP